MTQLVSQVVNVWRGADGSTAEVVVDGSPLNAIDSWRWVDALKAPARQIATYLLLEDGTRFALPFTNNPAYRLPDHTGVLAIFAHGKYTKPDGTDHFPAPNNAAIFNADGSLRCQVRFEGGDDGNKDLIICQFFTRYITHKAPKHPYGPPGDLIDPPIAQFGVLVGTKDYPPERFYILNTETGELTDGVFHVPY